MTKAECGVILTTAVIIAGSIALAVKSVKDWNRFKEEHNCKIVGKKDSTTSIGVGVSSNGSAGPVVVTNPSQTAWLCDDGITYWK